MQSKSQTLIVVFLASTLMFLTSGCLFNETIRGLLGKITVVIEVEIPGITSVEEFNKEIDNYHKNKKPINVDLVGPSTFRLTFKVTDPNKDKEHFGIGTKDCTNLGIEITGTFVAEANGPATEVVSSPNLKLQSDPNDPNDQVLKVTNSCGLDLRVTELDTATSNVYIPLEKLTYDDPDVSSLPWHSIISTDTDFAPDESKFFDVPDDELQEFCYVRVLFSDTAGTPAGESVYMYRVNPIPTLTEWGLIIMGLLMLAVGTVMIRRRLRPIPV